MQRRYSLRLTTKVPRLSKGSTRKFKTRRSQSSLSQTLIRPDFEPGEDFERKEVERTEEASERFEVEPREEVLFREMSKSETKSNKWRKEKSSLVKQSKNAMMSNISPSEEQTSSKAKKS